MAFNNKIRCVLKGADYFMSCYILWFKNFAICPNFAKLRGHFREKCAVF